MTDTKRITNYQLQQLFNQKFTQLSDDFKEFKEQYNIDMRGDSEFKDQYETDMRGDKKVDGNIGIMGEIRELRRMVQEYPSLLWLLTHKTKKTVAVIVMVFAILSALYIDDWRSALFGWLGIGH